MEISLDTIMKEKKKVWGYERKCVECKWKTKKIWDWIVLIQRLRNQIVEKVRTDLLGLYVFLIQSFETIWLFGLTTMGL